MTGPYQQAGLSCLTCRVSHYPGRRASVPQGASPNPEKESQKMPYKVYTGQFRMVPVNPSLPRYRSGTSQGSPGHVMPPRQVLFLVLPSFPSWPTLTPLRSPYHRCGTLWNLHQMWLASSPVFSRTPHIWPVTTKKLGKMPRRPALTLRPAASVPAQRPHWQ